MTETVETVERGEFRSVIEWDACPDAPYDDGGSPIFVLPFRHYPPSQVEEITSYRVPAGMVDACERWQREPDTLERFLRIFYGCRTFIWVETRDASYLTTDPAVWRAAMGSDDARPDLTEWRAYLDGETFVVSVERRETWHADSDPELTRETWETVDSLAGLYGIEYARETAAEMLETAGEGDA